MKTLICLILVFTVMILSACTPNQSILNSANESGAPAPPANVSPVAGSFEADLQSMRTADFNYIYVFRRKDGGILDTDDKRFMAGNTPVETNRRRVSDEGKAIITGSNYRFPPEIMKLLTDRFIMNDYSKPESEIMTANINSNSKGN